LHTRGLGAALVLAVAGVWRGPPSFRRRQDWYRIKVLVGRDCEKEISYPVQLQETWRVFGAAGLVSSKEMHLPRRVGAQDAETHGTSLAQISQAGRWNQSVLCKAYLTHLPRQFMRVVAGFSASSGDYFLACAVHEPPTSKSSSGPGLKSGSLALRPGHAGGAGRRAASTRTTWPRTASLS
jgi:hypothetical protein